MFENKYSIDDLATAIGIVLEQRGVRPVTAAKLRKAIRTLRLAETMTKQVKFLVDGVTTEEEFNASWDSTCNDPWGED